MDYYNYINQCQASLLGRQSSGADFTAGDAGVDVVSSRFSVSAAGVGSCGARYSGSGLLAHCGASTFTGGQHHVGDRLDESAITNGKLAPRPDSATFGRPFSTSSASAQDAHVTFGGNRRTATSRTVNNHHDEPSTSTPLHVHHQSQRPRYLSPPAGTVLPPIDAVDDDAGADAATEDIDDDGSTSLGDGRSSASSGRSSTSDCRDSVATAPDGYNDDIQQTMKTDKSSTNTAAAAATGLTSTQPLIYPWMRRVHSSNNGTHYAVIIMLQLVAYFFCLQSVTKQYTGLRDLNSSEMLTFSVGVVKWAGWPINA